jgi:hypothetical protein
MAFMIPIELFWLAAAFTTLMAGFLAATSE